MFEEVWQGMGGVLQEGSVGYSPGYLLSEEHSLGVGERRNSRLLCSSVLIRVIGRSMRRHGNWILASELELEQKDNENGGKDYSPRRNEE